MIVKRKRLYLTVALAALLALMTSVTYASDLRILDSHDDSGASTSSAPAAAAGSVTPAGSAGGRYNDTNSDTASCTSAYPCGNRGSIIRNGTFDTGLWSGANVPAFWNLDLTVGAGWVGGHASMNMARIHDTADNPGQNDALALFLRNVGGSGPEYMHASQALNVPAAGYYWVEVHGTMFGSFVTDGESSYHNAIMWYGIGKNGNAGSVTGWREIIPMDLSSGKRPCLNGAGSCVQVGRYETIWLEPGDVMYLRAGHKWSTFNNWTVFEFDDINIRPAQSNAVDDSGWWDVGRVHWDSAASR